MKTKVVASFLAVAFIFAQLVVMGVEVNAAVNKTIAEEFIIDDGSTDGSKVIRPNNSYEDLPIFANYLNGFRGTGPGSKTGDPDSDANVKITNIEGDQEQFTITFEYSGTGSLFVSEPRGLELMKSDGNGGWVSNPNYEMTVYDLKQNRAKSTITPTDILSQSSPYRGSQLSGVHNDFYKGYMSFMVYDDAKKEFTKNPLPYASAYQYWPESREYFPSMMSLTAPYDITHQINKVYIYNTSRHDKREGSLTFKVKHPFNYDFGSSYPVRITAYLQNNGLFRYSYSNWANYVTAYYNTPVVYCLNRFSVFPPSKRDIADSNGLLKEVDYSTENYFNPEVPAPKYNAGTKEQIAWIMRLGYPYDGAKLFNNGPRSGVPEAEKGYFYRAYEQSAYENATQKAIWHLTDNVPIVERDIDPRTNFVVNKLLELSKQKVEEDKLNSKNADTDSKFETFYLDNNNHKVPDKPKLYQNLVGMRYKARTTIGNRGRVKLNKINGLTGETINGGAKFDLYEGYYKVGQDNSKLRKVNSDYDLTLEQGNLNIGEMKVNQPYSLVETTAPNGMKISDPFIFRIAQIHRAFKMVEGGYFYNAEPLDLYRLEKFSVNDKGDPSWIPIKKENGEEIPPFTADELDKVTPETEVKNYPPIDMSIKKIDGITNLPLAGAEFKLVEGRNPDSPAIDQGTWTSTADSLETISLAREKVYTLIETNSPAGYRSSAPITFKIGANGELYKFDGSLPHLVQKASNNPKLEVKNFSTSVATLRTQAGANGVTASENRPVIIDGGNVNDADNIQDKLIYDGLVPGVEYKVKSDLYLLNEDGTKNKLQHTKTETFTPENSSGEYIVNHGENYQNVRMYANKQNRYLFVETITSTVPVTINGKKQIQTLIHDDPYDKSQMIYTTNNDGTTPFVASENATIKTVVSNESGSANDLTPLKVGDQNGKYTFTDTVSYTGLRAGESYTVTGRLIKVFIDPDTKKERAIQIGDEIKQKLTPNAETVDGSLKMKFVDYPLEVGDHKYVIWEKIESDNQILEKTSVDAFGDKTVTKVKQVVAHQETNAVSQTILLEQPDTPSNEQPDVPKNPAIRTNVSVIEGAESTAEVSKSISSTLSKTDQGMSFTDKVQYKDLNSGEDYAVVGQLMKITGSEVTAVPGATGSAVFVAKAGADYTTKNQVIVPFTGIKNLDKNATYVVYEAVVPARDIVLDDAGNKVVTPYEKVVELKNAILHEDKEDKAQIFLTDNTDLATKVTVDGHTAEGDNILSVISKANSQYSVKDTLNVTGLPDATNYQVIGRIIEKESKQVVKEIKLAQIPADRIVDFGSVTLKPNLQYVVTEVLVPADEPVENYEAALSNEKLVIHENTDNKAQTFVILQPDLKTNAEVFSADANKKQIADSNNPATVFANANELESGVPIVDTISYRGLEENQEYIAYGQLMRVEEGKAPELIARANAKFTARSGDAFTDENVVKVDFGNLTNLDSGKYVVFEAITKASNVANIAADGTVTFTDEDLVTRHENTDDKAQTILVRRIPDSEIKTIVNADEKSASIGENNAPSRAVTLLKTPRELEQGVNVTDKVMYKDFLPGVKYTLFGRLMKVADQNGQTLDTPQEVKTAYKIFTAKGNKDYTADNTVMLDFGKVAGLEAGKYVVFEYAAPIETTLIADRKINLADAVDYDNSLPEYPDSLSGIGQPVSFKDGSISHENAEDLAQTIIIDTHNDYAGAIKTTVTAKATGTDNNSVTAGDEPAKLSLTESQLTAGVDLQDKVSYKGLIPDHKYHLFGQVQKVEDDDSVHPVGDLKTLSFNAGKNANKSDYDPENAVTLDFGTLPNLTTGKYVVYEVMVPDTLLKDAQKTTAEITSLAEAKALLGDTASRYRGFVHEDVADKAQSFVVEAVPVVKNPVLRTVVSSGDKVSSGEKSFTVMAGRLPLVDTVSYEDLDSGKDYVLYGRLMRVDGGKAVAVDGVSAYQVFTAGAGAGEVRLDFGEVDLPAGSYVVFESASLVDNAQVEGVELSAGVKGVGKEVVFTDKSGVLKHEDVADKAQSFVVEAVPVVKNPVLRTTVSVNQVSAGNLPAKVKIKSGEAVAVTDRVEYRNLTPKPQVLYGRLMRIENGVAIPVKGAVAYRIFTPEIEGKDSTAGLIDLDFGYLNLPTGKYVVFESVGLLNDAFVDNKAIDPSFEKVVGKQVNFKSENDVITHASVTDNAQTFIIDFEVPAVPDKPLVPSTPTVLNPPIKNVEKLAATGINGGLLLTGLLFLLGMGISLLRIRYRKLFMGDRE